MNVQLPLTDDAIRAAIARRASGAGERDLRKRVLAAAAAVPQRRGWRVRLEQLPILRQRRATPTLIVALALLLAATIVVALVGSQIDRPSPGALGRLAYLSQGDLYVAGPSGESPRFLWHDPASEDLAQRQLVWLDPETVLMESYATFSGGVHVINVTTGANRVLDRGDLVALSPDRRVAAIHTFNQAATPQDRVRLIEIASGRVVGELPWPIGGYPPKWSPDGRSIAGETSDTIYKVDVATGATTVLAAGLCCGLSPHWPSWSADGSRVIYVDYHLPANRNLDCDFRCGTIWSVPAAGGVPTRLTPELGSEIWPVVSPDGRWIAYIEEFLNGRQTNDLIIIAADGAGRRVVTPEPLRGLLGDGSPIPQIHWDQASDGLTYLSRDGRLWHIALDGPSTLIDLPTITEFARQVLP
jgi:hypothetical protein